MVDQTVKITFIQYLDNGCCIMDWFVWFNFHGIKRILMRPPPMDLSSDYSLLVGLSYHLGSGPVNHIISQWPILSLHPSDNTCRISPRSPSVPTLFHLPQAMGTFSPKLNLCECPASILMVFACLGPRDLQCWLSARVWRELGRAAWDIHLHELLVSHDAGWRHR